MAGRPKAIIDWNKVDRYLQAQCDGVGIAGILGIAPLTLYRACEREKNVNFDTYSAQKKGEGVELLKAKQFQTAMEGNVVMQIWLGKQYAGQRDKQFMDVTSNEQPIFKTKPLLDIDAPEKKPDVSNNTSSPKDK